MLTSKADFDRFVEAHEPQYFKAQERGFTLIRRIEHYLKEADSYAGRYTGYIDHVTEDLVITGECDEEYEAAMNDAREVARMVSRSNGYRILRAQGRGDDAAMLVYEVHAQLAPQT
jgi:hypothetical protein